MRVTQDHIDNLIQKSKIKTIKMGQKTTVVHVTLPNGFEIVGSGSCVDPKNYDERVGQEVALEKIKNELWLLEGYLLHWSKNVDS